MQRQGDLLLIPVDQLSEYSRPVDGLVVLAGEHDHRLAEGRLCEDQAGQLFVTVARATALLHDEHRALELEPGSYAVRRQREYAPQRPRPAYD
ncbi:MAG: hypothetical protein AB7S38_30015 [Vulcanimicrobiota bacterium]